MAVDPPACLWEFPPADDADEHGIVGIGADLAPGTVLGAYRFGLFPMPVAGAPTMAWWSPDPRGVLELDALRIPRSLRQATKRYEVRIDGDFTAVIDACRSTPRPGGWITPELRDAYVELAGLGWAHSVETYRDGELVGGLYGVSIGGLFAGESMFHRARDASKVALVELVRTLRCDGVEGRLLDVQWATPHLRSLGATDVPRAAYLARLQRALELPPPPPFAIGGT